MNILNEQLRVASARVGPDLGSKFVKATLLFALAVFLLVSALVIFLGWSPFGQGYEVEGNVIRVGRGGNFQAALERARPGDTIMLEAGEIFKGAFKLPKKSGEQFITVRSSAPDERLPGPGQRIEPQKSAQQLPKIISDVKGSPAILAADGAHHYRFLAVEFGPTIEGLYNIIQIGTGEEKNPSDLPHHIEFDRVYIHGDAQYGQRRGIAANGRNIKIENSHISDIKRKGEESQAVAAWATDGPVEIINNYLEGAAENILFGGATSVLGLVPANCIIRDNHLNKPLEWREMDWVVKNLFEIKNGRRFKIENNLMTNNWAMGQDGTGVLFTTREDSGRDAIIEDVEFSGNIVRGSGSAISVYGSEGGGGHRLTVRNNLFEDINGAKWKSAGHFLKVTDWKGLTIENNTILQTGNIAVAYGKPVTDFVFRNNIVFENEYGIKGDNMGSGQEVIDFFFSGGTVSHNVVIGGAPGRYREKNYFPASISQVGFVNAAAGDYTLRAGSQYLTVGHRNDSVGAKLRAQTVGKSAKAVSP